MYDAVRFDSLGLSCGQNCGQFDIWAAVGGGKAYQRRSHGAEGFRLEDVNVSFGVQTPLNICFLDSWLTVGLAGSYEHDHIHFNQGGHGNANNWQGAFYYMWNNCNFYSFSTTILGSDCIKIRRPIDIGLLELRPRSRARITQWTSYSELGLNLNCDCVYIQPFVGIEYAFYRRHALSEHNVDFLGLHVRGKNVSATIGRLGAHLTTSLPCWGLFLSGDLAWRCRFNFLQERIRVRFQDFGSEFRIKGVHQKPNGIEGSINLAKCFCDRWQAYVEFAGEKWERYAAWNLSGGVSVNW
jgi:outer membrane autotransporter protein